MSDEVKDEIRQAEEGLTSETEAGEAEGLSEEIVFVEASDEPAETGASDEPEESDNEEGSDESHEGTPGSTRDKIVAGILVGLLAVVLIVVGVIIWKKVSENKDNDSSNNDSSTSSVSSSGQVLSAEDLVTGSGLITEEDLDITVVLGEYKGVKVTRDVSPVSDEEVDAEYTLITDSFAEEESIVGPSENGDVLNIDFEGYIDGEQFEGGTYYGFPLELGSGQFIAGFEEALLGAVLGEEIEINISFPEDYYSADLAGKPVTFYTTVNEITRTVRPEITDELIQEKVGFDTIDEYREYIREYLNEAKIEEADEKVHEDIIRAVINNATFEGDIEKAVSAYEQQFLTYMDNIAMNTFGFQDGPTLFRYLYGYTEEQYREEIRSESDYDIKYGYVLDEVAAQEGFEVTADEYRKVFESIFFEQYGFTTDEEVKAQYDEKEIDKMINREVLRGKAEQFLIDNAIVE